MRRTRRLEGRPELRPDAAFAQARNIGVGALVDDRQIIGDDVAARRRVLADHPGQVVVAVEDRRTFERGFRQIEKMRIVHAAKASVALGEKHLWPGEERGTLLTRRPRRRPIPRREGG